MVPTVRIPQNVVLDQHDYVLRMRDMNIAWAARMAGFDFERIVLNVKITIDGTIKFARIVHTSLDTHGLTRVVILEVEEYGYTDWYIVESNDTHEDATIGQFALRAEGHDTFQPWLFGGKLMAIGDNDPYPSILDTYKEDADNS